MTGDPSSLPTEELVEKAQAGALDIEQIQEILPHRWPFLLIDRVIGMDPQKSITALKNVTATEPWMQGHFPGRMVMPGVLQIEALAQAAAVLSLSVPMYRGKLIMLAGVDRAKFRRPVVPGDSLTLQVTIQKMRKGFGLVQATASVGERLALQCEIKFAVVDWKQT